MEELLSGTEQALDVFVVALFAAATLTFFLAIKEPGDDTSPVGLAIMGGILWLIVSLLGLLFVYSPESFASIAFIFFGLVALYTLARVGKWIKHR